MFSLVFGTQANEDVVTFTPAPTQSSILIQEENQIIVTPEPTPTLEPTPKVLDFSEKSPLLYTGYINEEKLFLILEEYEISYETYLSHKQYNDKEIVKIAQTILGECGSDYLSLHEKASVAWTILNHVDSPLVKHTTIDKVINKSTFHGYSSSNPKKDWCLEMAGDICIRWTLEKIGLEYVGRTLPKEYLFFSSYKGEDGLPHSRSRIGYKDRVYYDWSLPLPY